ncbi:MAG: ABC transporter permease, partial [Bacteroidota bacterium]
MFKNYLSVALRALKHQRLYTAINVLGLAVGLACAILIFLFVKEELAYDNFHTQQDSIYRMARVSYTETGDVEEYDVYLPYPLGEALLEDIPEVASVVQLTTSPTLVQSEGTTYDKNVLYAGNDFFNAFSFPLILGNPETALANKGNMVLSEKLARQLFGDEWKNAIGQEVAVRLEDDYVAMEVTAIAENPPTNSTIQFDYVLPFEQVLANFQEYGWDVHDWGSSWIITYVLLEENASPLAFQEKLPELYQKYYPNTLTDFQEERGWESDLWPVSYYAQPQADIHWNYEIQGGITESSNPAYSYNLGYMGAALLLIA